MADRKAVIGLVINPIAGMGGKVALKGTDGKETLDKARERGARPESLKKTERALEKLRPYSGQLQLLTVSGRLKGSPWRGSCRRSRLRGGIFIFFVGFPQKCCMIQWRQQRS